MPSGSSLDDIFRQENTSEPNSCCVIRIRTSSWFDRTGIHVKKDIIHLKRKCSGFNYFEEDISNIGSEEVLERCPDIFKLDDGVYEVYTINERSSWETPHIIEDYDYDFRPFIEEIKE
jgi:hypothetical protein